MFVKSTVKPQKIGRPASRDLQSIVWTRALGTLPGFKALQSDHIPSQPTILQTQQNNRSNMNKIVHCLHLKLLYTYFWNTMPFVLRARPVAAQIIACFSPTQVRWMRGGDALRPGGRCRVAVTPGEPGPGGRPARVALTLTRAAPADRGLYTLDLHNSQGRDSVALTAEVTEKIGQ